MDYRQRKCLYYGEMASEIPALFRPKAFKDYTMVNCLLECNAGIVMNECGCLPYHYPDFEKVWNTETSCNVSGLQCLADNYRKYFSVLRKFESDIISHVLHNYGLKINSFV